MKIAIVGISGSGKSTFARSLSVKTGLPLHHMDSLYWTSNWIEVDASEWQKKETAILTTPD